MNKYQINWFRYLGLDILANTFQFHFEIKMSFLMSFLMYVAFMFVCVEKKGR